MTTTIMIERDEAVGVTASSYHYTRVVEIAGCTVRARIKRDFYINQSLAVAEVLNGQMTWTNLAADAPSNWWHDAPTPNLGVHPATILAPLADRLLHRAAGILTRPPRSSYSETGLKLKHLRG